MNEDYDDTFDSLEEDETTLEIKRQIAKNTIDEILEKTLAGTLRTSRSIERTLSDNDKSKMITIRPNGIVVRDGIETKESFLDKLGPDFSDYGEITISENKANRLKKQLSVATAGPISAVAMICAGSSCQIKETCPYFNAGIAPLGEICILEQQLIKEWTSRYIDEFDVDTNKHTELQLVTELAEIAVYERRISAYIGIHNPILLQEVVTGVDTLGNPFYNTDISKAFEVKERLKKQRMKILDAMLATRDRKAKIIVAATAATSSLQEMSNVKKKFIDILKNKKDGVIIDG